MQRVARTRGVVGKRRFDSRAPDRLSEDNLLDSTRNLALEMALHDETERRALEGELSLLERAWRDADEIAAIADVLPEDPSAGRCRRFRAKGKAGAKVDGIVARLRSQT